MQFLEDWPENFKQLISTPEHPADLCRMTVCEVHILDCLHTCNVYSNLVDATATAWLWKSRLSRS